KSSPVKSGYRRGRKKYTRAVSRRLASRSRGLIEIISCWKELFLQKYDLIVWLHLLQAFRQDKLRRAALFQKERLMQVVYPKFSHRQGFHRDREPLRRLQRAVLICSEDRGHLKDLHR